VAPFRDAGAGAATTRFVSKPRVNKVVRATEGNISLAGVFPMSDLDLYVAELNAKPLRGRQLHHAMLTGMHPGWTTRWTETERRV
jgi:hypothetical protein